MADLLYKELTYAVIGAAMEVHKVLGSGFLEAVYQKSLARELSLRNLPYLEQIKLPVSYKDLFVGEYIADFSVDGKLIVEIKAVSKLNRAHQAQAMHYLASTGYCLALLINFGADSLEHRRVIK